MNKLCQTKPNSESSKMNIITYHITSYHSPVTIYQNEKRTQTKPNLPAIAGKFALSAAEGPISQSSSPFGQRRIFSMQKAAGLKLNSRYNMAVK
jgi:hypothetical protein